MEIEELVHNNSLNCQILDNQQIILQRRIGRGCQGYVYKALNTHNRQRYAVKVMNMGIMSSKEKERLHSEIQSNFTLSSLCNYQYFPYFYGYWLQ